MQITRRGGRSRINHRRLGVAASLLATTALATVVGVQPASALSSMNIAITMPAGEFGVGIDHVCSDGTSGPSYEQFYEFPTRIDPANPIMPNPIPVRAACQLSLVRIEAYTHRPGKPYSAAVDDGAVAIRVPATSSSANVGTLQFPVAGTPGTGHFTGGLLARGGVADDRIHIDIFQITGQRVTETGYALDAFSTATNKGAVHRSGPLWNGQYLAFVTDRATGRKASGFVDVNGDTPFNLDLDVTCFGIDECTWEGSTPTDAPGAFHPLPPTRIVDSRRGFGIPSPVTPGDGRTNDISFPYRLSERLAHEFVVAGAGGVPSTGVSAVLLNVTVTGGQTGGSLKVFAKPPRTGSVFDDQSSYGATPASNQVYWRAFEDSPNLTLVKVGVGGRVRIANVAYGDVHLVVDVLGWFDQGQAGQSGDLLTAVPPERALDTRNAIGGPKQSFAPNESRNVGIARRGNIPGDASSVLATVTGVGPTSQTYVTAWPAGTQRTETSVLNIAPGLVRPNLAAVPVGSGGQWSLFNERGTHDLLVDTVGYFHPSQGGKVTAVESFRMLDTQRGVGGGAFGPGSARAVRVAGVGPVPQSAKAVFLNTTVIDGNSWSYLTVWPGGARPEVSNLNWVAGDRRSNLVLVPVAADGTVQMFNAFGTVHVAAEVVGYVS